MSINMEKTSTKSIPCILKEIEGAILKGPNFYKAWRFALNHCVIPLLLKNSFYCPMPADEFLLKF